MKEKQIRVGLPLIVYVDGLIFYDAQNQLLSETIDGDTTSYTYDTAGNIRSVTGPGVTKTFTYDVTGLYKITYDAATKSLSATRVASYEYDAWGNVTYSTGTMAKTNPLKYRGYYHDAESGFYYLQSRYYDPAIGRFVNADSYSSTGQGFIGCNMFVYCGNNPINQTDPTGEAGASLAFAIAKLVCTIKEFKRVRNELKSLPTPSSDISKSFRRTLRKNANTVKRTTKKQGIIESGKQFYYKVRNKGEWDLKQLPEYQGAFQFNGLVIEGQDIGNINFGYTGKALGLPDSILLAGAGVAQIMAGTSNFSFVMASNGDDLRDQMYIMYGIILYREDQLLGGQE